jgi:hypothetical protein
MGSVDDCRISRRYLARKAPPLFTIDTRTPAERWPHTWPALQGDRMGMSRDDLDGLHNLWPDYWPPASAVFGEGGG